nr:RecX family transcriptional regulator [candidate division KSB1 bacterium]
MKTSQSDFQTLYTKLSRYCAYQDRCKWDVEMKLQGWQVSKGLAEQLIMELAKEGYVDDLRFARSFVRGKFRVNKWGKQRIVFELRAKRIDEQLIKKALEEIDEASYMDSIRSLIRKKDLEIK